MLRTWFTDSAVHPHDHKLQVIELRQSQRDWVVGRQRIPAQHSCSQAGIRKSLLAER
ncbi:MAG: hypothetical protein ACK2U3_11655 [Anaerolineales bacterium]